MCMTPWTVRLAISVAHSSPSRYSEVKGSASKSGPDGALRRSTGNRSRSVGTLEPSPESGPSHPSSPPTFHRIAQSVRAAPEGPCDGTPEAISCTSRGKSSGPPGVGSAHTSSSRKSRVSSWMRQGRDVCAVFGSLMREPPSIRFRLRALRRWQHKKRGKSTKRCLQIVRLRDRWRRGCEELPLDFSALQVGEEAEALHADTPRW